MPYRSLAYPPKPLCNLHACGASNTIGADYPRLHPSTSDSTDSDRAQPELTLRTGGGALIGRSRDGTSRLRLGPRRMWSHRLDTLAWTKARAIIGTSRLAQYRERGLERGHHGTGGPCATMARSET
jgi:hypothetical protein